jgi:hypothetical protein
MLAGLGLVQSVAMRRRTVDEPAAELGTITRRAQA